MGSANESQRYIVTSSVIGWANTQNDPCNTIHFLQNTHKTIQWRHKGRDGISNHQPHDCFLNCLFRRRSKKTSRLRITGLCVGNSQVAGEFPAQMPSYAKIFCHLMTSSWDITQLARETQIFYPFDDIIMRHPIACPHGQGMGCPLWGQNPMYL